MEQYVSCIKVDGRPILPPVLDDAKRKLVQQWKEQALAVEAKLKEKKRAQLMEHVRNILDRCINLESGTRSITEWSKQPPIALTPVKINSSQYEPVAVSTKYHSLPSTPHYDEDTLMNLRFKFLAMRKPPLDVSLSENSAMSTDLAPYMQGSNTSSSESTTPHVLSDTDVSSLECSTTPRKSPARIRRLSYTLEGPSPILLKHLKGNERPNNDSQLEPPGLVPKLDLSVEGRSTGGEKSSTPRPYNSPYGQPPPCSISLETPIKAPPSNDFHNEGKLKASVCDDLANGNHANNLLNGSGNEDKNGNNPRRPVTGQQLISGSTSRSGNPNLMEEFLTQQQLLMKELLEQQALEQERLLRLFKEQEQQLVVQLQHGSANGVGHSKSPACRNLNRSFERAAKARRLFESGRLSALVRGYLTRRLLATDRVQGIVQTIRDTTTCLKELNQGSLTILPSDVELHRRLIQQLHGAVTAFHEVFFHWGVAERMLAIRRDREKKALMVTGMPLRLRPRSRSLSSATQKSLNRKHTPSNAPSYRGRGDGTASSSSSRPSSASTALPRTSPSSFSSSVPSRRSPSSSLSSVSAQSNGTSHAKKQPLVKGRKPWRC